MISTMEDSIDHHNAHYEQEIIADLSPLHLLVQSHQGGFNTQGTGCNKIFLTHKKRDAARLALVVCAGFLWPDGPSY